MNWKQIKEVVRGLKKKNVLRVTLGKRILRSDTAAISSLFCIQSVVD